MSLAAAPRSSTPDLFDTIYAQGRAFDASLKTVTASFVETTTSSLLARPLVSKGTLAVIRPSRIALRYEEPEPRLVLIDKGALRMVWPSHGIDQRSDIGATLARVDRYFIGKSPAELRRSFEIAARDAADRPHAWEVTMKPRRSQIQQGVSRIGLWIDRSSMVLQAMRLDFPNGDTKLMTFSNVVVNESVDPRMFEAGPPR